MGGAWCISGTRARSRQRARSREQSGPDPPATRNPGSSGGDLHGGQTGIGCGAGSLEEQFVFARDVASLQFTSQQANDHYIPLPVWNHVREVSHAFDDPGRFTCFLGCEWSPFTVDGGDRNVIYRSDESRFATLGPILHRGGARSRTGPEAGPRIPRHHARGGGAAQPARGGPAD